MLVLCKSRRRSASGVVMTGPPVAPVLEVAGVAQHAQPHADAAHVAEERGQLVPQMRGALREDARCRDARAGPPTDSRNREPGGPALARRGVSQRARQGRRERRGSRATS